MRSILCLLLFALTILPKSALALSCYFTYGEELISQYPVIFQASPLKSGSDPEQVFQIKKVYKGDVVGTRVIIRNPATQISKARQYDIAKTYVFFFKDKSNYQAGPCSPEFSLETINAYPDNYWAQIKTLAALETKGTKSREQKSGALKNLSKQLPNSSRLLEENAIYLGKEGKYSESIQAYQSAFKKKYENRVKEKSPNKSLDQINADYTRFSQNSLGIPDQSMIHMLATTSDMLVPYGKVLYQDKRYTDAAKVFGMAKELSANDEINKLYLDALSKSK